MAVIPKTIISRLKELNIGCKPNCAKAIATAMNKYGITDFDNVLEELKNDDTTDPVIKERGWTDVLVFKWRCGFNTFKESLINSVDRLGKIQNLKQIL